MISLVIFIIFLLRKAYLLGQVGLLHKIKCKEVLWVACMKRSLRLHCHRELMEYWATDRFMHVCQDW